MTLSRRRLLTLSAAFACAPAFAQAHTWQGRAFGGDISLTLTGPRSETGPALTEARRIIARMERLFSLYDPASALTALNRDAVLHAPDPHMVALLRHADRAYKETDGLFDPTIQPLWRAYATGHDPQVALPLIGWPRVRVTDSRITLDAGQALTLNGIAQGYATDVVTQVLTKRGLRDILVNIGEYRATGAPRRLALHDPTAGALGTRTLRDHAIATSSPDAMHLGAHTHILHPKQRALWSTVSVEAATATHADALSTALVFAPRDRITAIKSTIPEVTRITLVDTAGNLTTL